MAMISGSRVLGPSQSKWPLPQTLPTTGADALNKIKTLYKSNSNFTERVDHHVRIITALSLEELAKVSEKLSEFYRDHPHLGQAVQQKLGKAGQTFLSQDSITTQNIAQEYRSLYATLQNSNRTLYNSLTSDSTENWDEVLRLIAQRQGSTPLQQRRRESRVPATQNAAMKQLYTDSIRSSAMLGYPELQPLANMINRTIVVVRAEARGEKGPNNIELIVPTSGPSGADYIYVQNLNNVHFKTFNPEPGQAITKGTSLNGVGIEGDYTGAGTNDCLIASLRKGGADFGGRSNSEIRNECADHVSGLDASRLFPEGQIPSLKFKSLTDLNQFLTANNAATVSVTIAPDPEYSFSGLVRGGKLVDTWQGSSNEGLYEIHFNGSADPTVVKTGSWGEDGLISPIEPPQVVRETLPEWMRPQQQIIAY